MYTRRALVLAVLAPGVLLVQDARSTVQVSGAVKQPLTLSADDLAKMP
jgi:DMSO/TMAO reductase YedYZ molybdopterin-dependent catalytic subunit